MSRRFRDFPGRAWLLPGQRPACDPATPTEGREPVRSHGDALADRLVVEPEEIATPGKAAELVATLVDPAVRGSGVFERYGGIADANGHGIGENGGP